MTTIVLAIIAGALALAFASGLAIRVLREDEGAQTMRDIAQAIRD